MRYIQLNVLFDQAVQASQENDGADAFDLIVGKATTKSKNDTLKLSNGGEMTREQFVAFMQKVHPNADPKTLNEFFDQMKDHADRGKPFPYDKRMDQFMNNKEEAAHGTQAESTAQEAGELGRTGQAGQGVRESPGAGIAPRGESRAEGQVGETSGRVSPAAQEAAKEFLASKPKSRIVKPGDGVAKANVVSHRYFTKAMREAEKMFKRHGFTLHATRGLLETDKKGPLL